MFPFVSAFAAEVAFDGVLRSDFCFADVVFDLVVDVLLSLETEVVAFFPPGEVGAVGLFVGTYPSGISNSSCELTGRR